MKEKYYSQYLLRALDGEDLQLDEELSALAAMGSRVRCAVPVTPPLHEDARRRIWNSAVAGTGEAIVLERRAPRIPRLAWAGAAAVVLAIIAVLVIFLFNGGGPVIREPLEMASLYIESGEINVRNAQGEERPARSGEALAEGDMILASADARGIVEFAGGSVMRLDGKSEIGLTSGEEGVEVEVIRGNTYNRVIDGESYVVSSGDVSATALGTAFVFDVAEEQGKVVSVHSSLRVDTDTATTSDEIARLEEGGVFFFGKGQDERFLDVTREELDNEWIRWNKALDEDLGLPIGVLSVLEEEAAAEEPQAQPEQPEATPPAENQPDQPAPQPPAPQPPAPLPPADKSVTLSASAREGAVDFSWTLTGYTGFQGFKLCRSETNPAPSYPGDWWKYIDGANTRSATDSSVEAGHTYFYRLAVYSNGTVLGYSNAVQVTVPGPSSNPSISLSGVAEGGKVKLSWSVSDAGTYDGFKVCRSETNPNPSYPADTCTLVPAGQYYYTDTSVVSGKTYYYRVGIYKGGTIVKYSNAIQVTVP
jgi:hypothetical protein